MSERPWTVILVDDDEDLRLVMRRDLEKAPGFDVVDEGDCGEDAVELVTKHQPDVLLLDLGLSDIGDQELIPKLMVAAPQTMIAVLTGRAAEDLEQATRAAGAFTFYEKSMIGRGLVEYLHADRSLFDQAIAGEHVVAPSAIRRRPSP